MTDRPIRVQISRRKGWRLPPNTVKVDRSTKRGNPFDFRRSEYCWAALSFGCRGDATGRQEASIRAFRQWNDPPYGRQTLCMEEQPKMVGPKGQECPLGPARTIAQGMLEISGNDACLGARCAGLPCPWQRQRTYRCPLVLYGGKKVGRRAGAHHRPASA